MTDAEWLAGQQRRHNQQTYQHQKPARRPTHRFTDTQIAIALAALERSPRVAQSNPKGTK